MLDFSFKEIEEINKQINKTDDIDKKNELDDVLIKKINYLSYEAKNLKKILIMNIKEIVSIL